VEASDGASAPVVVPHPAGGPMLLRGRQRVTLLAQRVEASFAMSGWHVEPVRWATDAGAVLAVRGPGDACVEVRFTIGVRGKRSTVGVEFRASDGNGDGKAVIEALVDTLREPSSEQRAAIRP
jgi:hypothetical protein